MTTITRPDLIREAWRCCRPLALRHFTYEGGYAWRAELPRDAAELTVGPADTSRLVVDVFVFMHEVARDHPFAPQSWRVVCEGVTLETGVYPP